MTTPPDRRAKPGPLPTAAPHAAGDADRPSDRFELRLLPQPVRRYSDPVAGLVDGAIFLMSYGRNPEVVLLIEARRDGPGAPSWHYGLARLRVSVDDREVADLPKPAIAGPKSPFSCSIGRRSA